MNLSLLVLQLALQPTNERFLVLNSKEQCSGLPFVYFKWRNFLLEKLIGNSRFSLFLKKFRWLR